MKRNLFIAATLFLAFQGTSQEVYRYSEKSGLWGYITESGTKLTECTLKGVTDFNEDGLAVGVDSKLRKGVVIHESKGVISGNWEAAEEYHVLGSERIAAKMKGKWGMIDLSGKALTAFRFTSLEAKGEGVIVASEGNAWSIVSPTGEEKVIAEQGIDVRDFREGLAPFRAANKLFGFVNKEGVLVVQPQFESVGYFSGGLAWVRDANRMIGFIDANGAWIVQPKYNMAKEIDPQTQLALVKEGEQFKYVHANGTEVIVSDATKLGEFSDGLAYAFQGDRVGFVDATGKWVVPAKYDRVRSFENGYAAVMVGGKWGLIDKSGKEIVPLNYDHVGKFSDGLIAFEEQGKWGYMDPSGKIVVAATYEKGEEFEHGHATVKSAGKWGLIDSKGASILATDYIRLELAND